jgi:hypothetical protein
MFLTNLLKGFDPVPNLYKGLYSADALQPSDK